jgi:hypothetical protein
MRNLSYNLILVLSFVFLTTAIPVSAENSKFGLLSGAEKSVCAFVLDKLESATNIQIENLVIHGPTEIFGDFEWNEGSYRIASSNAQTPISFAHYDIDNDGEKEILHSESGMYKSHENTFLYIYEQKSVDFTKNPLITQDLMRVRPSVSSNTARPYSKHGLYFLRPAPLTHGEINYLVLMDELFGRQGFDNHMLVVARYAGIPMENYDNGTGNRGTDQLEIICKIESKKAILPWEEPEN